MAKRPPPGKKPKSASRKGRSSEGRGSSARKGAAGRTPLPSRDEILTFINENPGRNTKRDIARAFGLRGADRIPLKALLKDLEREGLVERDRAKNLVPKGELPPVTVLEITGVDDDGETRAKPTSWRGEEAPPPIYVRLKRGELVKPRDRILARLEKLPEGGYSARIMRQLEHHIDQILGIYQKVGRDGRILPIKRGSSKEYSVRAEDDGGAQSGDLVSAEPLRGRRNDYRQAKINEVLGQAEDPRTVSLIAIHDHEIPFEFPDKVILEAERAREPDLKTRRDLTHLPFVTIDPADARDHDDAIFAEADKSERNPGGHIIWVAIADVAHFVRPGSALDKEARNRGNSCYFPDRVVPMLPDNLSGDLCSLHEGVVRSCMVVRMTFDQDGEKVSHEFMRAAIRSLASLTYDDAQSAHEGMVTEKTEPLLETVIKPLFAAYKALSRARDKRGPLGLDMPEHQIEINAEGHVSSIAFRDRFEAHRLVEDCMVQANVAAAETLLKRSTPLLFRIHEPPDDEKAAALNDFLKSIELSVPKGGTLKPGHFNRLLTQVENGPFETMVSEMVLRTQSRAEYAKDNVGHFGLNLKHYAHFTSPIRRYADLIVHRALIRALKLGDDGLTDKEIGELDEIGEEISMCERRALAAERDSSDRYVAAYMEDHVGADFVGRVSGVAKFGLFVKLEATGADGLVPIRTLGQGEYFSFDEKRMKLIGERSGQVYHLGMEVMVRLVEATPITGGLIFQVLSKGNEKKKPAKRPGTMPQWQGSNSRPRDDDGSRPAPRNRRNPVRKKRTKK